MFVDFLFKIQIYQTELIFMLFFYNFFSCITSSSTKFIISCVTLGEIEILYSYPYNISIIYFYFGTIFFFCRLRLRVPSGKYPLGGEAFIHSYDVLCLSSHLDGFSSIFGTVRSILLYPINPFAHGATKIIR